MEEAIEFTGLDIFRKMHPRKLSGGLLRRLNIACGIAHKPRLIIMDEPNGSRRSSEQKQDPGRNPDTEPAGLHHYLHFPLHGRGRADLHPRIAIMDHGRVIAQGTKEELKQMIKTGETITVEAIALEEKNLQDIRTLDHVFDVQYEKQVLVVRCTDARHNLIRLLNYLQSQDISFGRVFSELPTLNDVFLEITENS